MPELKMISPLLDHMMIENTVDSSVGCTTSILRSTTSSEQFVLKIHSVPAKESQIQALVLSGAYADEAAVHEYYSRVVADIKTELETAKRLGSSNTFAVPVGYQIETKTSGIGFDVYILYPVHVSLGEFLAKNALTNLKAVNLGIDLCDALIACRKAGYIFENINPETVFLVPSGRFQLGDLGLADIDELSYSSVPEAYLGAYAAPELSDIMASPNATMDLYSIGMLLFRIYNGNHGPFEDENTGESMAEKLRLTGKPLPTPIYADYELAAIILKACASKPEDRFQSPEDLKQALVLYMQRNAVSDTLIVPPIVASEEPIPFTEEPEAEESVPMRMTDAEKLDDTFRQSFAPDLSGAGTASDVDSAALDAPSAKTEAKAPDAAAVAAPEAAVSAPESQIPAEDMDPDQMDLDTLLASINAVVGEELMEDPEPLPEETASLEYAHIAEPAPEEEEEEIPVPRKSREKKAKKEKKPKKKRSKLVPICIILALILAILVAGYFVYSWYMVSVTSLSTVSQTTDTIVVAVDSEDDPAFYRVLCTDIYGNAYPGTVDGNHYTFTGLSEKTTYTVSIVAAQKHKLAASGVNSLSVSTHASTVISDLLAVRGTEDGQVILSFNHEGPTPEAWKLSYTNDLGQQATVNFTGTPYTLNGLTPGANYTFTLENSTGVFLRGDLTEEFELLPIITATDLKITGIDGNNVSLAWTPGENMPETWHLVCSNSNFYYEGEVTGDSCTVEVPGYTENYVFTLTAAGMDTTIEAILPANPIVINDLHAELNADGSVTIAWDAPAAAPAGGWYVTYNTVGSLHADYLPLSQNGAVSGTTVTLTNLIPNTEYRVELELTAADLSTMLFGTTELIFTTPETEMFEDFNITPVPPFMSLWEEPKLDTWYYYDLSKRCTTFFAEENIVLCIQPDSFKSSDETVTLLYVVRDSEGHVVNYVSEEVVWDDMWYSRRHTALAPRPASAGEDNIPGDYVLEVYVNYQLLAEAKFSIA